MSSLEALFWDVDDFCQAFEPQWNRQLLNDGVKRRNRPRQLSLSTILTLLIAFLHQGYRTFKGYYQRHVREHWATAFPGLVSSQRFVDSVNIGSSAIWRLGARHRWAGSLASSCIWLSIITENCSIAASVLRQAPSQDEECFDARRG